MSSSLADVPIIPASPQVEIKSKGPGSSSPLHPYYLEPEQREKPPAFSRSVSSRARGRERDESKGRAEGKQELPSD